MGGMRWRTEKEVVTGRGQFACANKKCEERNKLRTWEVNFGYLENNEKKNALVKCRLCFECSYKLNYHHKKKEVTRRKQSDASSSSDDNSADTLADRKKVEEKRKAQEEEKNEKDATDLWSKPVEREDEKSRTE